MVSVVIPNTYHGSALKAIENPADKLPRNAMEQARKTEKGIFFTVRIHSIPTDLPLPYDVYLWIDSHAILFRKRNEVIDHDRMERLKQSGVKDALIPDEQRQLYIYSLLDMVRHPDLQMDIKARFIKETAFVHVHDLFTQQNIATVLSDSKILIEEVVKFIAEDMEAATSLMRLSNHDYYTYNHSVNVAVYSIALAKKIIGDDKLVLVAAGFGGLLHDIGKRKVDLNILNKEGPLEKDEWRVMKKHPDYGLEFLRSYVHVPQDARDIVGQHHENFDGTGYPGGLKEEEISKLARICAIADVFDALTTTRSYREAMPPTEALETMFAMQPGKFDPAIFRHFNKELQLKGRLSLEEDFDPCDHEHSKKIKKG
ncbi:MAG: HD-GYP domain-containing protein [Bdellovibrionaceae bacterium]|nr:HD-GYP domain-containing protein [Pseudobdellovibrionaceae bacterium]